MESAPQIQHPFIRTSHKSQYGLPRNTDSSHHPPHQHHKKSPTSDPYHDTLDAQQNTLQELTNVFKQFAPIPIKQKEASYPNITPAIFLTNIPIQKPNYRLPRVKTTPTSQSIPRVLPSIEIEDASSQNETFTHVIAQEEVECCNTKNMTPRRSPQMKNKPTIHMGNFIKRIYLTEKYNLRKGWNASPQLCRAITDPMTGNSLEYRDLIKDEKTRTTWNTSFVNELGRLANGLKNRIKGTNTIKFIPKANVHIGKTVTYGRIVVDYRPQNF